MTCVGGEFKQKKNFWTVGHENELSENTKNKKRKDRLILTLHPAPLPQYSPVCNFYFPGSPLCFSSRCLHLSAPPPASLPPPPPPLAPPPPAGSTSCFKQEETEQKHFKNDDRNSLGAQTSSECVYMRVP